MYKNIIAKNQSHFIPVSSLFSGIEIFQFVFNVLKIPVRYIKLSWEEIFVGILIKIILHFFYIYAVCFNAYIKTKKIYV